MLPCIEDEKIILYSLGDPYRYLDLMALYNEVNYFKGKDSRFYKVINKEEISKDINHFSTIRLEEKAFREFERLTGCYESTEYIDTDLNVGYRCYFHIEKSQQL